jgi:hypothetical protein
MLPKRTFLSIFQLHSELCLVGRVPFIEHHDLRLPFKCSFSEPSEHHREIVGELHLEVVV